MQAQEIEHYLAELGAALQDQGIVKPVRLLLIGGAYMMLLANAPRTTDDVDIFWIEEGEDFQKHVWRCETLCKLLPAGTRSHQTGSIISPRCSSMIKLPCRE